MKCPKCGQEDFFKVEGWETTTFTAYLNNLDIESSKAHDTLQLALEPDSYAVCTECGHENDLNAFGPGFPFPILSRLCVTQEAELGVTIAQLVQVTNDLLGCIDLSVGELDPSLIAAIENARRITDAFKGHLHDEAENAIRYPDGDDHELMKRTMMQHADKLKPYYPQLAEDLHDVARNQHDCSSLKDAALDALKGTSN